MTKLNTLTIDGVKEGYQAKNFTILEVVSACQTAIQQTNPLLNSFLTLSDQALIQAKKQDEWLSRDRSILKKKPLFGIPLAIKDNFLTQGLLTTASSKVLANFIPPYNATVVAKLIKAGAIILGKTNMDAWAHGSSTETSDFGATKNPWNPKYLPGGSSGGSAAAVASHQCIAAIGSETAGSIRQPAAWCGITGFKPTYGRVSRYGVIAMASSTDTPGPMTKNVSDAITLLEVMAGFDPYDATTIASPLSFSHPSTELKNKIIGLPQEYLLPEMDLRVKKLVLAAAGNFERLGARVVEVSLLDPHYAIGVYTILQRSEVSSNLARYDGVRFGQDRLVFGEEAKRRILLGSFSLSSGYYDAYYKNAQKVRTLIVNDFNRVFKTVDAVIGPTSPGTALPVGATKNQPMFGEMEDILVEASSIAGLTSFNVPCGFIDKLPVGLQITAPQQAENLVYHLASAYQNSTQWHLETSKYV